MEARGRRGLPALPWVWWGCGCPRVQTQRGGVTYLVCPFCSWWGVLLSGTSFNRQLPPPLRPGDRPPQSSFPLLAGLPSRTPAYTLCLGAGFAGTCSCTVLCPLALLSVRVYDMLCGLLRLTPLLAAPPRSSSLGEAPSVFMILLGVSVTKIVIGWTSGERQPQDSLPEPRLHSNYPPPLRVTPPPPPPSPMCFRGVSQHALVIISPFCDVCTCLCVQCLARLRRSSAVGVPVNRRGCGGAVVGRRRPPGRGLPCHQVGAQAYR